MECTRLLNNLVALDARITGAISLANQSPNEKACELIVTEIRVLRKKRLMIVDKLATHVTCSSVDS